MFGPRCPGHSFCIEGTNNHQRLDNGILWFDSWQLRPTKDQKAVSYDIGDQATTPFTFHKYYKKFFNLDFHSIHQKPFKPSYYINIQSLLSVM